MNERKSMRRLSLGVAAGALAVTIVVALSASTSRLDRPPASSRVEGFPRFDNGSPFLHGHSMSLSDAQTKVGFDIPRPDDKLASDSEISVVWVDTSGDSPQVELDYSSGVYVLLQAAEGQNLDQGDTAQEAFFKEQAAADANQTNGAARALTVNGRWALLVPQDSGVWANGQSQGNPGGVEFVLGGYTVDVDGRFSDSELLRVASTVSARPA